MLDVFAAPPRDRYQVVTEHPRGQIIAEGTPDEVRNNPDVIKAYLGTSH